MKLQDYLHYYLGCSCIYYMADDDPAGYHTALDYDLIKNWLANQEETDIKLQLRRLEDITEGEWNEVESKTSMAPDAYYYNALKDCFLIAGKDYRFHWFIVNEALIELRKRSIDVDGLIDAGLAIDIKTTTP